MVGHHSEHQYLASVPIEDILCDSKILCHSNAKSDPIIAQFVMNRCCANSPQLGRGLTLVIRIAGDEPERSLRELATRFTDTVNAEYSRVPGRGHKVPTPWEGDERWRCRGWRLVNATRLRRGRDPAKSVV